MGNNFFTPCTYHTYLSKSGKLQNKSIKTISGSSLKDNISSQRKILEIFSIP